METIEVCNIWLQKCETFLRKDEVICPWCKGWGGSLFEPHFKSRTFSVKRCILCSGHGKIDWILSVTKKPPRENILRPQTKTIKMRCTGPLQCRRKLKRIWDQREKRAFGYNEIWGR